MSAIIQTVAWIFVVYSSVIQELWTLKKIPSISPLKISHLVHDRFKIEIVVKSLSSGLPKYH